MASVSAMMKQNNARKAEKALKEILDKADGNGNGMVELSDFMTILEMNGVEVKDDILVTVYTTIYSKVDDDEMTSLTSLISKGGICKADLLTHTKNSRFWKEYIVAKNKPASANKVYEASSIMLAPYILLL